MDGVMLCEVPNAGGSAVLRDVRLVGGDACGIVCRVLARGSGRWLGRRVLGACAALRRRGVGPPFCEDLFLIQHGGRTSRERRES